MNDDRRKMLTEYIGECWHDTHGGVSDDMMSFRCSQCGKWRHFAEIEIFPQRTFTTWADLGAVYSKMVEKGALFHFMRYLAGDMSHYKHFFIDNDGGSPFGYYGDISWLFCLNHPEHIADRMELAAEFLEGRK